MIDPPAPADLLLARILDRGGASPYKQAPPAGESVTREPANGAQVAQLVEHCTENAGVGGSIPPLGTTTSLLS